MIDVTLENKLLYQICSNLLKAQDDDNFLNQVVADVCQAIGAICCSIWVTGDTGIGQKRIAFQQSVEKINDPLPNLDFLAANYAIEQRRFFVLHNVKGEAEFSEAQLNNLQITTCPLDVKKNLFGVLCIWNNDGSILPNEYENYHLLLQKLADEISYGLYNIKYYSNKRGKRIKKELEIARNIQNGLIPKEIPVVKGVSLGARTYMANEIGGDYLDLFTTKGKNLGIAIGDVMGKGIPAALWMAMTRVTLRTAAIDDSQPQLALQDVNSVLFPDLSMQSMFVTLMYALYNPANKTLLFSNAGHLPPLLYHSNTEKFELLKIKGAYIGGVENKKYKLGAVQLHKGDIILFYTDGLTEAKNIQGEQMGIKKIVDIIRRNVLYKASEIIDSLSFHIGQHIGDYKQSDDITFALLKVE